MEANNTEKEIWSYSRDQESYHGRFDTWHEAALNALIGEQDCTVGVWVGLCEDPTPPETFVDAETIIEHVQCQDEYSLDCAEDWPNATKKQMEELEELLSKAFSEWLDKHDLRPKFWLVNDAKLVTKAQAIEASQSATPVPVPSN